MAAKADVLDDRTAMERLDPDGLVGRIEALPEQCAEAWDTAADIELPPAYSDTRRAVVLGMGGSAIAGDLLRAIGARSRRIPVQVVRGYELPAYVDEATLVIACSHSGNTEETLSSFHAAVAAGALPLVMSTGGRLSELARERGFPLLSYRYDGEPRSSLGHQIMRLLAVGEHVGLVEAQSVPVAEALALMRAQRDRIGPAVPSAENPAKQIARRLHGRVPAIFAGGLLFEAAHRWKTQLNENGKTWALYEEVPELGHNAIEGFGLPEGAVPIIHVVFLAYTALQPRLLVHYEALEAELAHASVSAERVEAEGESPIAQLLTTIYLGDFVSYYLGLLNGARPSPVPGIERLKSRLAG